MNFPKEWGTPLKVVRATCKEPCYLMPQLPNKDSFSEGFVFAQIGIFYLESSGPSGIFGVVLPLSSFKAIILEIPEGEKQVAPVILPVEKPIAPGIKSRKAIGRPRKIATVAPTSEKTEEKTAQIAQMIPDRFDSSGRG